MSDQFRGDVALMTEWRDRLQQLVAELPTLRAAAERLAEIGYPGAWDVEESATGAGLDNDSSSAPAYLLRALDDLVDAGGVLGRYVWRQHHERRGRPKAEAQIEAEILGEGGELELEAYRRYRAMATGHRGAEGGRS